MSLPTIKLDDGAELREREGFEGWGYWLYRDDPDIPIRQLNEFEERFVLCAFRAGTEFHPKNCSTTAAPSCSRATRCEVQREGNSVSDLEREITILKTNLAMMEKSRDAWSEMWAVADKDREALKRELAWHKSPGRRTESEYNDMGRPDGWTWLPHVRMWSRLDQDHWDAINAANPQSSQGGGQK